MRACLYALAILCLSADVAIAGEVSVGCRADSPQIDFAVARLEQALQASGSTLRRVLSDDGPRPDLRLATDPALPPEGFRIAKHRGTGLEEIRVSASDDSGAMYGLLDIAEQVRRNGGLEGVQEKTGSPRFAFRAIKFNLPWMSYRKHQSLQLHLQTCRDLAFWEGFLDMMAENRFNVLTLWNLHPFTFMIRPNSFPEACPWDDRELAEWQTFWRTLFKMAKDRGIETYLVNWNIFVSPEFAEAHNVATYSKDWTYIGGQGDTSELVKRYTRECVTQVIDEYDDLTGLGITLGEQMGGMTPQEREDWLLATFGEGIRAAKRPIKFIHRAPLSANLGSGGSTDRSSAEITRDGIAKMQLATPPWVEIKFNWSHGYSSPKLCIIHGGKASEAYWEPEPEDYKITWMIRNEDFFILPWGEPDFIRKHIELNGQSYVGGYFVGSECYIPADNYIDRPELPARSAYAYQRQWLFYMLWGRLLYDPATPGEVFEHALDERYGQGVGKDLLPAFTAASRMPLRLGSFHKSSWDFTLYAEGFLAGARGDRSFITVQDLIKAPPLDPDYVSIPDYVTATLAGQTFAPNRITPALLAESLSRDGESAIERLESWWGKSPALDHELAGVQAWSHLSLYFAEKLRAAVALQRFHRTRVPADKQAAVASLQRGAEHWENLVDTTRPRYAEIPLIHLGKAPFSWAAFRDQVQQEIEWVRNADGIGHVP